MKFNQRFHFYIFVATRKHKNTVIKSISSQCKKNIICLIYTFVYKKERDKEESTEDIEKLPTLTILSWASGIEN